MNEYPQYTEHMRNHITGVKENLQNNSPDLRQCSPEQILYHEYLEAGLPHGPALYAVKGEHWNGVSPKFLEFVNHFKFRREDMGYAECGYGIQKHRDFMKNLVMIEHHLADLTFTPTVSIDVGCFSMTTRMAMYDLAKVAFKHSKKTFPHKKPIALVPTPSWDYRGIFHDVGFEIVYLPIRPENGWLPNLEEWSKIIQKVTAQNDSHIALLVSNPQHNPTGKQWPIKVTQYLLELAAAESSYLLLDDAYYNVHDPRVPVCNHLKAILTLFTANQGNNALVKSGMFTRWVATRPFGKQFSCNTMGVAAITTSPILLGQLAHESWINRYHCNTHNAELMCAWLATPEAKDWTLEAGLFYTRQKERVSSKLIELMGWPQGSVCIGPSTSYMLFEIPKIYQDPTAGIDKFRNDLFYATGTMICASLFNQEAPAPYVRLHLGSHPDIIEEILRRWQVAGLHYQQKNIFPGKAALKHSIGSQAFRVEAQ